VVESADAKRVLSFRLSDEQQTRRDVLLEKNREGTLTSVSSPQVDHVIAERCTGFSGAYARIPLETYHSPNGQTTS
jgi:hypothetical protein